jgi:hypothetical protein
MQLREQMPSHQDPTLYQILEHPLLLLIVGAIISSLVIPLLTRRWQNHQKELDLKVGLVSQINEYTTDFLMTVQFAELGSNSQQPEDFDRSYREWEIRCAKVRSYLYAYFPESRFGLDWDHFSELVTQFYALTGIPDEARRRLHIKSISCCPLLDPSKVDWDDLSRPRTKKGWLDLRNEILRIKDTHIKEILHTRMVSF